MGSRLFDFIEDEERIFREFETLRTAQEQYRGRNDVARTLGGLSREYPWVKGGAALPLAEAGYDNAHPVARQGARLAAKRKTKRGFWETIGTNLKGTVRTAFTVLETPLQEIQGQLRAIAHASDVASSEGGTFFSFGKFGRTLARAAPREFGKSTGALALGRLAQGEEADLGEGFFSGGQIREQHERKAAELKTSGRQITTGRLIANVITEPGTKPYNALSGLLDAGVALGADPANVLGGVISKVRQARRLFTGAPELAPNLRRIAQGAGLVDGPRKTVVPELVENWLQREGRPVVDWLARTDSFDEIYRGTRRGLPAEVIPKLQGAKTADEVVEVLRPELGITIREKPELAARRIERTQLPIVKKNLRSVRLLQQMPGRHIDLDDLDQGVEQIYRFGANAKLDLDATEKFAEQFVNAKNRIGRFRAVTDMLSDTKGVLASQGVKPKVAKRMTRIWNDHAEDMRHYFVDEIGRDVSPPGVVIGGNALPLPTPHLYVEYINRVVPLPDARDIRRVTSRFPNLWMHPAVELPTAFLDATMNGIWKVGALARLAWPVRVISEEQARMGASGLDSAIVHPLSWVAYITGKRGALDITGETFKEASKVADHLDEHARAMSRGTMGLRERGMIRTKNKVLVRKDSEHYARSWADELMQLRTDPIAQKVAATPLDEVKNWFWDGAGQGFRKEMAEASGREVFLTRAGADAYLDSIVRRIEVKTAGDSRLVDAISTGKLDDVPLREGEGVSKKFMERLETLSEEGIGPEVVKGDQWIVMRNQIGKVAGAYDRAVETVFNALMSRPTNYLSRSPAFRQFYWRRADELMPLMDEAAQKSVLKTARETKLAKSAVARLEKSAAKGKGALNLDEADAVAKGFALDSTRGLLYDLTERSQFFDIARHFFPFGEAWKEVMTRWAKIGAERPQVFRRFQQTVEGARGSGFFYIDPQSGEEMFGYPGSEFLTEHTVGAPVRLAGRVSGLNVFSSNPLIPGFGPVVGIAAGELLPDKPSWDRLRDIVLPFGAPDTEKGFLESLLPPWIQKFRDAIGEPAHERLFNNTVFDVARYLVSTSDYSVDSEAEVDRVLTEAKSRAKRLYALRGAAQFVLPSAPKPEFLARDSEGHFVTFQALSEDYRKMLEAADGDETEAVEGFLSKYGEEFFLFMQGKSRAIVPGVPQTKEALDWIRSNPEVERDFPHVYGFFAPQGKKFDIEAFGELFERTRQALTPEQAIRAGNHRVASMIYRNAREQVGDSPSSEQRGWLRELSDALKEEYPGYRDFTGIAGRASTQDLIGELSNAASDPRLKKTEAGKAISLYLQGRNKAQASAESAGLAGFQRAKSARDIRDWLRELADALIEENPAFEPLWEQVFSRELPDEVSEEQEEEVPNGT